MATLRQQAEEYIAEQVYSNSNHEVSAQNIRNSHAKNLDYTDAKVKEVADNLTTTNSQLATIGSKVGELSELQTTEKSDIVKALNEVKNAEVDAYSKSESDAKYATKTELNSRIGNINELTTSAKDNTVSAINEVNANKLNASTQLEIKTSSEATKKTISQIAQLNDAIITISYLQNVINLMTSSWKGLRFTSVGYGATIAAESSYNLEYSNDLGNTWHSLADTPVIISDVGMWVRGNGFTNKNNTNSPGFVMTGNVSASGSMMSLLDGVGESKTIDSTNQFCNMFNGCTSLVQAPALPATTLASNCYRSMFNGCTSLVQAPALPATTLESYCYYAMFMNCTSLVQTPALPATTLASYCYRSMFSGCTSLVQAPTLPATTLASYCYRYMFNGCTSLVQAPTLPATTLASYCYYTMFSGCTSLTQAPTLPATTLASNCYYAMFFGCINLKWVELYATDISAADCITKWVSGVAATGVIKCNENLVLETGESGIPSGWTRENI